jgi:hypothetical protein
MGIGSILPAVFKQQWELKQGVDEQCLKREPHGGSPQTASTSHMAHIIRQLIISRQITVQPLGD